LQQPCLLQQPSQSSQHFEVALVYWEVPSLDCRLMGQAAADLILME
jgi:hypothetical protein